MCPSILNADHSKLQFEIDRVAIDSDYLHLDVMDNIFVPNLTFSLDESRSIIEASPIPVDAHLMINNPDSDAVKYAKGGAANVTFHIEASEDPLLKGDLRTTWNHRGLCSWWRASGGNVRLWR